MSAYGMSPNRNAFRLQSRFIKKLLGGTLKSGCLD